MDTVRIFLAYGMLALLSTTLYAMLVRSLSYTQHRFTHFLVVIGTTLLLLLISLSAAIHGMFTLTQILFIWWIFIWGGLANFLEYQTRK